LDWARISRWNLTRLARDAQRTGGLTSILWAIRQTVELRHNNRQPQPIRRRRPC